MAVDDSYTKSLLHFDGADTSTDFTDESGKTWDTLVGSPQIDIAYSEFGGASGYFGGSVAKDAIYTVNNSDFDFGTGDWTIDFWTRLNGTQNYGGFINKGYITAGGGWSIGMVSTNQTVRLYSYASGGGQNDLVSNTTLANLTWTHIAVVRYGNNVNMYFGGTNVATRSCTGYNYDGYSSAYISIGRAFYATDNYYLAAWIDEMRVSKGIARWTSNFTPPTSPYAPSGLGARNQAQYLSDFGIF